jgi:hypothetical protein
MYPRTALELKAERLAMCCEATSYQVCFNFLRIAEIHQKSPLFIPDSLFGSSELFDIAKEAIGRHRVTTGAKVREI